MKRVTRKALSLLLSFVMLLGVVQGAAVPAFAEETGDGSLTAYDSSLFKDSGLPAMMLAGAKTSDSWKNHSADSFAGGSGTQDAPYQIATAEQLSKLAADVAEGNAYNCTYFRITNDLDLSAYRWNPIGLRKWDLEGNSITAPFGGVLDGNDKTITGLYVDERSDGYAAGLFGYIQEDINAETYGGTPEVKNLTIANAEIYSSESGLSHMYSGILAGQAMVNDGQRIVISNVKVSGSVVNEMTNGNISSGGLIGDACRIDFTGSIVDDVSVSGGTNSGGFVGVDSNCTFTDSSAYGEVSGAWAIGGFSGFSSTSTENDAQTQSIFKKCISNVNVTATDWRVGGFVGYLEYGKIDNCAAMGEVISKVTKWEPKAGGFCGEIATATIGKSYAAGKVTCDHPDIKAGGFIGYDKGGTTTNCMFDSTHNPSLSGVGKIDIEGSNDIKAEFSASVLSEICTDVYGSHSISKIEAKAPTETESGNIEYWYCSVCGKCFSDETLTEEISKEDTIIPVTGGVVNKKLITAIVGLPAATSVANGTALAGLGLPAALAATINGAKETINVTWNSSPEYNPTTAGTYTFTPVLPNGYVLGDGVNATFKVTVNSSATVSGVAVSPSTVSVKKGSFYTFSVSIEGANSPSQSVTWSVTGNHRQNTAINQDGKLTVASNETTSILTVKATLKDDATKYGTAIVTVTGYSSGNTHSSAVVATPSLPSSATDAATNAEADFSGASFPLSVTKITFSAAPETPTGISQGTSGGTVDTQGTAAYYLAVHNTALNIIGKPFLYRLSLLDQNGNALANFTGTVRVKIPLPAGLRGTPRVFRYESDGTLTDMNAAFANGSLVFSTTHFSDYIIAGTGDSITLDTVSYQMPVNGSYQIGLKLTGGKATLVKFHSTNEKTATVKKLANGNYQVTGKNPGTVYIMFDVYDNKNQLLTHTSVRVDVKTGIRPKGDSTRQIGVY